MYFKNVVILEIGLNKDFKLLDRKQKFQKKKFAE